MQHGEISESGSYQALLEKKGSFAEFLLQHLQETNEDSEDLEEIKKQLENDIDDADLKAKLERAISRSRSDSTSESESLKEGKNLSRQSSVVENGSLRKRKSATPEKKAEEQAKEGQDKLIEVEKAETGRVSKRYNFIIYS